MINKLLCQQKLKFFQKSFKKFSNAKLAENIAFKSYKSTPSVTVVRDKEHAKHVINLLNSHADRFHSWDTETVEIDPKEKSPVGHGRIVCLSCFAGPDIDFGNGPSKIIYFNNLGLFIDNYAECTDLVLLFKDYFENKKFLKVWHNYGFDRHILYNHGINVQGFGADTLHMARMYDTSRLPNEFALNKLSEIYHDDLIRMRRYYLDHFRSKHKDDPKFLKMLNDYESYNGGKLKKIDMKKLFQYKKILASGEEGKSFIMPEIEELHTNPKYINNWIKYSVLDAEITYYLRDSLQVLLQTLSANTITHTNPVGPKYKNNYDLYMNYWRNFGELMTDMERVGIRIDIEYLRVYY